MFFSSFTPMIFKALWNDCRCPIGLAEDESIHSFVSRRFGDQIAEYIFDPMISGIYAGDIKQLSIKACIPWLYNLERKHGCVWKGMLAERNQSNSQVLSPFVKNALCHKIFTYKNGVETIINKLTEIFEPNLRFNCPATKLNFENGTTLIELQDKNTISADVLYSAIPPPQLAKLVKHNFPILADKLNEITSTSLAVVNLGYHSSVLQNSGFGYLIPSKENQSLLGATWDSCAFPQQNKDANETRISVMLGGAHFKDFDALSDNKIIETAMQQISEHLNLTREPACVLIKRAPQAIPQYTVGHEAKLRFIEAELQKIPCKVKLLGSGFYGIAVNSCIARAESLSKELDEMK